MMQSRVTVTVRRGAPTDGLTVVVGKESTDSTLLDLATRRATSLSLIPVCEMVERAITVAPVRIVRKMQSGQRTRASRLLMGVIVP